MEDTESQSVFGATFGERKKSIETLVEESRADAAFYIFLTGSAIITALGLIIDNAVVVIGGMLVAPLLFPILSLGMGIVTSSRGAIMRSLIIIAKSVGIVFGISLFTSFLLDGQQTTHSLDLASRPELVSFVVAFTSGIIGAYSWVKQDVSSLPGVAIAVSLIPPLSAVGIGVALFSQDIVSGAMTLFILNLLGIVFAGMIVFSLFGFSRFQKIQEDKIQEENELKKIQKKHDKEGDEESDPSIVIDMNEKDGEGKH